MIVRLCVLVIAASFGACQTPSDDTPNEGSSQALPPAENPPPPAEAAGLQASTTVEAFGMAMPEGAVLDTQSPGTLHFSVRTDFDSLLQFYERTLPDARLTRYERGARFETNDGSGRSVYLYRERGSSDWLVTVFDAGADPSLSAAANTAEPGAAAAVAGGGQSATPAGQTRGSAAGPGAPQGAADGTPVPGLAGSNDGTPSDGRPPSPSDAEPVATPLPLTPQQLDSRVGSPYTGDPATWEPGTHEGPVMPVVHPRVQELIRNGQVGGVRRPLNFSRGPRESRTNPDAMF